MRMAASMLVVLRSLNFSIAMALTCALVSVPILSVLGRAEPFYTLHAAAIKTEVGEDFTSKSKERSE